MKTFPEPNVQVSVVMTLVWIKLRDIYLILDI